MSRLLSVGAGLYLFAGLVAGLHAALPDVAYVASGQFGSANPSPDPLHLANTSFKMSLSVAAINQATAPPKTKAYPLDPLVPSFVILNSQTYNCSQSGNPQLTIVNTPGAGASFATLSACNITVSGVPVSVVATLAFDYPNEPNIPAMPLPFVSLNLQPLLTTITYQYNNGTTYSLTVASGSIEGDCSSTCPSITVPSSILLSDTQPTQKVTVGTTVQLSYALIYSTTSGGNWLTVTPTFGQTGSGTPFTVTANATGLKPGQYGGVIRLFTPDLSVPHEITISVSLTIASPFTLVAAPSPMMFSSVNLSVPASQNLAVTTSPSMSVPFTAAASSTGNWLSISSQSGTTGGAPLVVSVDPTKVSGAGPYTGTITLTAAGASNSPLPVSVTLDLISAPVLTFTGTAGGSNPGAQQLNVTASGPNVSYTAAASSSGNWLSVSPGSGTTGGTPQTVSVNIAGLTAKTYTGTITITPAGGAGVPVNVTLNLASPFSLVAAPSPMMFSSVNLSVPASQNLTVTTSPSLSVPFTAAASSTGNWLSISSQSGTTGGAPLVVSVDPTKVSGTGPYTGTITLTAAGASNSPLPVSVSLGITGFVQPTVTQISNAASESLSVPGPQGEWNTLPNGAIAQGSYFTIYGNGFGGDASVCGASYQDCYWHPYPLPTQIHGASVRVTIGQNAPVMAYLEFAAQFSSYSQINAILPSTTPIGAGTLTVSYNGQTSAPVPINVVASSFGAFTLNEAGSGPAIITHANYAQVTPFNTAKPGEAVILWGTGLGPAPDPGTEPNAGPCPNACDLRGANLAVTVWVGNQQADIYYAGRAPGYTGEDEIVFYVPSNVTTGCNVSVAVQSGPPGGTQITSNFTSMAVDAKGGTCDDTDGVNMSDIVSAVQSKSSANVAAIGLLSNFWNIHVNAGTVVHWDNDTVDAQIGTFGTAALELFRGFTRVPSVNSCTVIPYQGYPPPADYGLGYVTYLDAGSALSILGPIGTQLVPKNADGNGYDGLVGGLPGGVHVLDITGGTAPFYYDSTQNGDGTFNLTGLASGSYMVTAPGGTAVSSFAGTIDVSPAAASFVWTNSSTFNNQTSTVLIPRDAPLSITWTGGDPQGYVDITLLGSTVQNTLPSQTDPEPAVYAECVVPTSIGSFNVPTYVLQALPSNSSGSELSGAVLVGQTSPVTKITPTPAGLDAAYLYYRMISGYTVQWQ